MKIKTIEYRELFNTGNYTNATIGVTVELNEGDSESEALERAKAWVRGHQPNGVTDTQYKRAKEVMQNPDQYLYGEVERSRIIVQTYEAKDDLPF